MKKNWKIAVKVDFLSKKTQLNWNDFYSFKLNLDSMQWHLSKLKKKHFTFLCMLAYKLISCY